MKVVAILFLLAVSSLSQPVPSVEDNRHAILQFLIDNSQLKSDSQLDNITLDKNNMFKIRVLEGEDLLTFGLLPKDDSFEIVKYCRKKLSAFPKQPLYPTTDDELSHKISDSIFFLRGGKIVELRRPSTKNRSEVEVEYKVGNKVYTINGFYSHKSGELFIRKVQ
jgi:hypothetical protein